MNAHELEQTSDSLTTKETSTNVSDMTYWDMSILSYRDIEAITNGTIKSPAGITADNYPNFKVKTTPDEQISWQIVKALDEKETDTQAFALKKDNDIVIAYRGSQEVQDWVDTDYNYLLTGSNRTPARRRAEIEALTDPYNIRGTAGVPNTSPKTIEDYEQQDLKNPFDVAVTFAEDVRKEFPEANIDTTGHSLGGSLATYVRAMATHEGKPFVRQTTTFAAPNVYGMLPNDVQDQIDQGLYRNNTIDYTDKSDSFGTLNDRYPQVGAQFIVDNEKFWLGNHSSKNFSHLFLADGQIRLTPETMRVMADKAEAIHDEINDSYLAIEAFDEIHDTKIKEVQSYFEGQVGYVYDKLDASDVKAVLDKLAMSFSGGNPKFYDTGSREELLDFLMDLKKDAKDIKGNLNEMANTFEEKDDILAGWLNF